MDKTQLLQSIQKKYHGIQHVLHERAKRIWAATEARQLGWGGVSLVEEAIGMSPTTIRRGLRELQSGTVETLASHRSRLPGGGRKKTDTIYTDIHVRLDALTDPVTRGDSESPLRWTCKSTWNLADELTKQKISVSHNTVRRLLLDMDYSLQANRKAHEGEDHPDRHAQFLSINERVQSFLHADQPVISVDTKKKPCCQKNGLGNYSNRGREYPPKKKPTETNTHDFPNEEWGKAIP
jgi:hypothetical protein